jgi:DNA polymerase I-like protein with 3'-5' exonuclease and polymerase domains
MVRPSPTGRAPSRGPNLQVIPIRTPEVKAIREALIKHLEKK